LFAWYSAIKGCAGHFVFLASKLLRRRACGDFAMNDTPEKIAAMVAERHRQMTPEMRMRIASQMFDTARAIVESSLPVDLSPQQRRLASIERLYGDQLTRKAKLAYANYRTDRQSDESVDEDVREGLADSEADRVVDNE
jgi:hypothetical protein